MLIGFTSCIFSQSNGVGGELRSQIDISTKAPVNMLPSGDIVASMDFSAVANANTISRTGLAALQIVNARIYLTGAGFSNPMSIDVQGGRTGGWIPFSVLEKIVEGTKVTFDTAVFRNRDGSQTSKIQKSFIVTY